MAAKFFCDMCEKELAGDGERLKRKFGEFKVEIILGRNDIWNDGMLCEPCILRVINEGKTLRDR